MANLLSHVLLGSDDVERSVAFYRDVLGLALTARFGEFAFFEAGGVTLGVSGELARRPTGGEGYELVFGVPSLSETFDALRTRIRFINEPRPVNDTNWAVNFRDPDGHALSFYGPK